VTKTTYLKHRHLHERDYEQHAPVTTKSISKCEEPPQQINHSIAQQTIYIRAVQHLVPCVKPLLTTFSEVLLAVDDRLSCISAAAVAVAGALYAATTTWSDFLYTT